MRLESFTFKGDLIWQEQTTVPLNLPGISLVLGRNHDAGATDEDSNGSGKTRLFQILSAYIYNTSDRGNFKKMIRPEFSGRLDFTKGAEQWGFGYELKDNLWDVVRNQEVYAKFHKPSDSQKLLQELVGFSQKEWGNFVHVNRHSICTLLSGASAERRRYLESFFNIDDFYEEKRKEYAAIKKHLEEQLNILEQEKARLEQVNISLHGLESTPYLQTQLTYIEEYGAFLSQRRRTLTAACNKAHSGVEVWNAYYKACTELEEKFGADQADEKSKLTKAKALVVDALGTSKARRQQQIKVQRKVDQELPQVENHILEPLEPSEPKPQLETITDLEKTHSLMKQKETMILRYKKLQAEKPAIQGDFKDLEQAKEQLLKEKAELISHIELVKDGTACGRCGQSLEFVLAEMTPEDKSAELQETLTNLNDTIKSLNADLNDIRRRDQLVEQLKELRGEIEAFGVFGKKIADVEEEIAKHKKANRDWINYERELTSFAQRKQKKEILLAELAALEYPQILQETLVQDIQKADAELVQLEQNLKLFEEHDKLLEEATTLQPKDTLVAEHAALYDEFLSTEAGMTKLSELKGQFQNELTQVSQLLKSKSLIEDKLKNYEEQKSEYKVIDALAKFFSPAGFKLFELRRRCEYLIEKVNFWSPVFCREQYEWSMPDDLDDLDFLVQPVKNRKTVPYSASLLSAGEENRAERVLLFAQLDMAPANKALDLLILDEIEGNLDPAGRRTFTEVVIPKLKETFPNKSVIIISHEESLKKSPDIDHLWLVEKKNRSSSLKVITNVNRKVVA